MNLYKWKLFQNYPQFVWNLVLVPRMSVKKAITILDLLIENKVEVKSGILELLRQWGSDGQDIMSRNARMITNTLQNDIEWLQAIKRHLLPEQHRTKIVC